MSQMKGWKAKDASFEGEDSISEGRSLRSPRRELNETSEDPSPAVHTHHDCQPDTSETFLTYLNKYGTRKLYYHFIYF